jgi:hypothetical protein
MLTGAAKRLLCVGNDPLWRGVGDRFLEAERRLP